jgi:hypothetical protein
LVNNIISEVHGMSFDYKRDTKDHYKSHKIAEQYHFAFTLWVLQRLGKWGGEMYRLLMGKEEE